MDSKNSIINAVSTPFLTCSSSGEILSCNVCFADFVDYNQSELITNNILHYLEKTDHQRISVLLSLPFTDGFLSETDLQIIKKNGRRLDIDLYAYKEKGNRDNIQITIIDKSLIKKLEKEKLHMLRLASYQSKMKDMEELVSAIAHEINNPLAVVLGFSDICLKNANNIESDPKLIDQLTKINRASKRISESVNSLKCLLEVEDKSFQTLCLKELVNNSLPLFQIRCKKTNIMIQNEIGGDEKVYGNRPQIRQIISNIFSNAFTALIEDETDNPFIQFRTKRLANKSLQFIIENNGPMIENDLIKNIFHPFYRTKENDVGLGLSIASEFIKNHRGTIVCNSTEQKTQFILTFPNFEDFTQRGQSIRVLVVDDEPDIRELINQHLTDHNMFVIEASDGLEALKILENQDFDVVITDIKMPNLNGRKLIEKIHQSNTSPTLIAISAFNFGLENQTGSANLQVDAFYPKPFEMDKIITFITDSQKTNIEVA